MSEEEKNPGEESGTLSKARKTALLRYLAVLFAFAFILVAVSLFFQMRSSNATILELNKTSSSALSNAEALQADNRDLQSKNALLQEEVEELKKQLAQTEEAVEDLQQEAEERSQEDEVEKDRVLELEKQLSGTKIAYDALLTAQSCDTREGNVTFSRAMETLEQNKEYLGQIALQQYEALMAEDQEEEP